MRSRPCLPRILKPGTNPKLLLHFDWASDTSSSLTFRALVPLVDTQVLNFILTGFVSLYAFTNLPGPDLNSTFSNIWIPSTSLGQWRYHNLRSHGKARPQAPLQHLPPPLSEGRAADQKGQSGTPWDTLMTGTAMSTHGCVFALLLFCSWKKSWDQPRQHIKEQRLYFANKGLSSQGYGFSSGHVWMWELDWKESWALKNWCFWTVLLEKTLESPLDCKEIQPVHPEGHQSCIFIVRTDAEIETPILWPPDAKNWLISKDPDAGKDWRREEKGMTEDEMVGWHHRLNGHEFE